MNPIGMIFRRKDIMKTLVFMVGFFVAVVGLSAEVVLNFGDPKEFTDFKETQTRRLVATEYFAKETIHRLERVVEKAFPEGVVLTLNIQDIDLAGGFEKWRPDPLDLVRIYKRQYPPVLVFSYRLEDKEGNVLTEGEKKLKDLGYQDGRTRPGRVIDPFYYEWRLLESWINTELEKR
jgi:hypothetical protein